MSASIEYRQFATPEPYKSAPTPANLTAEDYKALTDEWAATEERYNEAVMEVEVKRVGRGHGKKVLDDLVKAKEKEDEDNKKLLAAARIVVSGEDGNTSVVESGGEDGNALAGPLVPKCLKTEPEPMAQDKVYTGSECCGKCRTDKAICFVHGRVCTCQHCHVKKAQCTFNKGGDDSGTMESTSVLKILQDISARLAHLEDKMDAIAVHVKDLVDDYNVNNEVKYPEDFILKSVKAEFEASRMELQKASNIYCEVLREVAKHWLDRDMVLIKAEGLTSLSLELLLGVDNPYEILNKSFWIRTVDFYNTCGCWVEWQLWKQLLKDQEGYWVEDSDEPLDLEEEVQQDMIPGAESVGIPELDALIKMPIPELNLEEEVEKERCRQAMARLRAEKREKGEVVESEVEMYEDLEPVLVQEVEKGKEDVEMVGPSGTDAA
ncbi:hypothetical protein EV421DRAFT_1914619 [Armillaria borealis]|uniref:Zn(2)-C6 fungal-type domain-containing protein n=1 Tax=Armillaria borealis TaxID=47425 RepID=A0AA39ITH2_9AGAR|nr:hypothetical protein EV421DRAFT_1914619 [Armillaria borealis]